MPKKRRVGLSTHDKDAISHMVHQHGLKRIVTFLADIAVARSEDLDTDREVTNSWARDSRTLDTCASKLED